MQLHHGGVGAARLDDIATLHDRIHDIAEALAVFITRARQNLLRIGRIDIANSIDRNNRTDHDFGARHLVACRAEAAFHGVVHAEHFADGSTCTCTDIAFADASAFAALQAR